MTLCIFIYWNLLEGQWLRCVLVYLCLGQRSAAIVTPIAGTTRDVIETALNIGGFPVVLSDTAGLRYSEDLVENEGIQLALDR